MEKFQLINFIAKIMEDADFKTYKNFKTSDMTIDIYGVLPTLMGDFGIVVACKNYNKDVDVGIEVLKDMEIVGRKLKASKVAIVTNSSFSSQSMRYGLKKDIKLIDRENLIAMAKKFSKTQEKNNNDTGSNEIIGDEQIDSNAHGSDLNNENQRYSNPSDLKNFNPKSVDLGNKSNRTKSPKNKLKNIFSKKNKTAPSQKNNLSNYNSKSDKNNKKKQNYKKILKSICSNTIVMIIIVVLLSYSFPYILGKEHLLSTKLRGIVNIVLSLIFSYGLVLAFNRDKLSLIFKGTLVFFVSLIILIILSITY
ncbi:MAG: restriction endonuclease [Methanobrevibacter sp.]|nr:restriction endonuclease [Methanobrevibacter sp.]